jgi:hypothetical protein
MPQARNYVSQQLSQKTLTLAAAIKGAYQSGISAPNALVRCNIYSQARS